jgi:hypothetical protein
MRYLLLLLLAQDLSGNGGTSLERTAPIQAYDEGVRQGRVYGVDCRGSGVTCQRDGGYLFMTIPGGSGGSGGKVAEAYMADASTTANQLLNNPTDCSPGQFANAIDNSGNLTCATPGGGGSVNAVEQSISISEGSGFFSQTVTGQTWVSATSKIVCSSFGTTADGLTPEVIAISGITISVSDIIAGTGFNLNVFSPYGIEGTVRIYCIGS